VIAKLPIIVHPDENQPAAFAIGAVLYALDGLIVVAVHDWAATAIHTVVLVMMVRGLDAGRRPS